jgi:hypothetical protein
MCVACSTRRLLANNNTTRLHAAQYCGMDNGERYDLRRGKALWSCDLGAIQSWIDDLGGAGLLDEINVKGESQITGG